MRLLPNKHVLQFDALIHLFAAILVLSPALYIWSGAVTNYWPLAIILPLQLLLWYHAFWQTEPAQVIGHVLFGLALAAWATSLHWVGALFFFFVQSFLLQLKNFRVASMLLCVQALIIIALTWLLELPWVFGVIMVLLTLLGGHANLLFFRHVNAQRELLQQQDQIEYLSRERERERIARDLHDLLGHTLTSIALKAELAQAQLQANQSESAEKEVADIADIARKSLADVRQTVTGYRSGTLSGELTMAQHALAAAGVKLIAPDALPKRISREVENLLSLVLREAITNIVSHAKASECRVQVVNRAQRWHLVVTDNGIGWRGQIGNGLTGMRERLFAYGGELKVSALKPGTRLEAEVPQLLSGDLTHAS